MFRKQRNFVLAAFFSLFLSVLPALSPANAQTNGISIDFAGAEPTSYSHVTGGGKWGLGTIGTNIVRSLEGSSFACGDKVSFLTRVDVANSLALRNLGAMTLEMKFSFDLDTTGQSGVALGEPISHVIDMSDSANNNDGGSGVSLISNNATGPIFTSGSTLLSQIQLTDVEAGEVIVIRSTLTLLCNFGSTPTGNLQAKFSEAFPTLKLGSTPVAPAEKINSGEQTVPLKSANLVSTPELEIAKTVTIQGGSCPGAETLLIEPNQTVRYCYVVTNPSNRGGKVGAPLFNLSTIADDSGKYPDFTVALNSGLSDIDLDGEVDDLAPDAVATAYYEATFDGDKDTTLINLATITGRDAPTGGNLLTATDTATVFIDAPGLIPSVALSKFTNGQDSITVLAGETVTWTYVVTNTGNAALSGISVSDDKGVSVICPETTLAVAGVMTCTGVGTAIFGAYTNIGTVTAGYETATVTGSDWSSYFGANPKIDIEKTPDTQLVVEGDTATFTITVTNIGNIALSDIEVSDALVAGCDYTVASLAAGASISYSCTKAKVTAPFTNLANVAASWNQVIVQDSDTAAVTIDYLPTISVNKEASETSIPESGANVTYTVSVKNDGVENFRLNSLVDDRFGNLSGLGSCSTPQTITAGATYTCTFTKLLKSEVLNPHINIVTAAGVDPESNTATASDDATVNFTDVLPDVSITKVANPTTAKWSGDYVDYTLTITNVGNETFVIATLVDDKFTLSTDCLNLIGQYLAPGASLSCVMLDKYVSGVAGGSFVNTATVTGRDNEMNVDTATASATVNFWWYGRTPGYWKNHPEEWPSGYLPGAFIQNVFAIPSALLTSGVLNLNGDSAKDTMMAGLSYRGGSTLSGGAQILLRAGIAALLNKAYYGSDYPIATSPADLISQINAVLATGSRSQYLAFASYLDYWNNAVHSTLP